MLPDSDRAGRIDELYGDQTRTFGELLIDLEESSHARAIVIRVLRERELRRQ